MLRAVAQKSSRIRGRPKRMCKAHAPLPFREATISDLLSFLLICSISFLILFLFFLFLFTLLPKSVDMALQSVCLSAGSTPWCKLEVDELAVWKAPLWPSKWMIVVAASLLLLQGVVKLIADVMILLGWDPDQEAFGPVTDGDGEKVDV